MRSLHTVLFGLLIATSINHAQAASENLSTYTVKRELSSGSIDVGGVVVAKQAATLTAQLPGRVKAISGKEGDAFKVDQLLVQLDDAELQAVMLDHPGFGAEWRQKDLEYVLSDHFKEKLVEHNIHLVSWKEIRKTLLEKNH